ncbi:MAG: short-chain dehydrogenase [Alphaproteobacteria bacterium]|jgi:3-oxoacyl-[acyl-carrier protein] reductase|nr:short-chain dehydrogenase [Alphaproteobacteria bacterium]PPR13101.1 MAG: 3-oxoacyl-[acyl-carrier-protein] reductase FabG [Alphaproteobacteria bacterium MarineAlpha12_Bin1]|tara:strand:+ start:8997 stop:9764 length:768 start_codon:yes stop_codon:yes gene_type:complete
MRLKDKVTLVTGGSSGIGAEICKLFAEEGSKVAVVASRNKEKAQEIVDGILKKGHDAEAFSCDVRKLNEVENLVDNVIKKFNSIDILINAAGVFYPTRIGETLEKDFDHIVDTCLKGTFFMCNAICPLMVSKGSGKIVNFGSAAGIQGRSSYIVYGAAKAGIMQMTKSLACAVAPSGINVNCISPGNTATPMNEDVRTEESYAETREIISKRALSGRPFSDPKEIANMALFLSLDITKPMHGETVVMDEGANIGF